LPVIPINEVLPSFSTFAYKMFVQKSNVKEKELANDVSVRNQILSIKSYSTNLFSIVLFIIFTDIWCERERVSMWCKCVESDIVCVWSLENIFTLVLLSYIL